MQPLKVPRPIRFETPTIPAQKDFQPFVNDRGNSGFVTPTLAIADRVTQFRPAIADPGGLLRIVCKGRLVSLIPAEIEFIKSAANYVEVHAGGLRYRVRSTLKQFQTRLNPTTFVRIHRCTIVNLRHVKNCRPIRRGDSLLTLLNGRELVVSRKHKEAQNALRALA
ncbi:MAG TPA: LytTR family DNA-binding domain-containing protein [Terriglobales bacterium]|jgi:DNA-binding LytR/AlgR family response regulator|nr:LytTR family DNA-binding domain-containing protein [Terriglobales bacterium]